MHNTTTSLQTIKTPHPGPLRLLSLCSGIGGDVAALQMAGPPHELVAMAELDPVASAVLAQRFPNTPNLGDITTFNNWSSYHGHIDLITAGIPCQPHSIAGRRRGLRDDRDLTRALCHIVTAVRPEYLLLENVPGFATSEGGRAYAELTNRLERAGYAVGARIIDAADFLPQSRKRLWFLCHRGSLRATPQEVLAVAAGGDGCAQPVSSLRLYPAGRLAGSAAVHHPSRLGCLTASGSGLSKPGMKNSELSFLVVQEDPEVGLIVRRPTPLEALRAQGFPDDWLDGAEHKGRPLSDSQRYKLIGNSWPIPVAAAILRALDGARRTGCADLAA